MAVYAFLPLVSVAARMPPKREFPRSSVRVSPTARMVAPLTSSVLKSMSYSKILASSMIWGGRRPASAAASHRLEFTVSVRAPDATVNGIGRTLETYFVPFQAISTRVGSSLSRRRRHGRPSMAESPST
jgi:hypothetical protein